MTAEVKMRPYHCWKAKTEKEKRETDTANAVENNDIRKKIEEQRKNAEKPGTKKYEHVRMSYLLSSQIAKILISKNRR